MDVLRHARSISQVHEMIVKDNKKSRQADRAEGYLRVAKTSYCHERIDSPMEQMNVVLNCSRIEA